jgi:general secretion pathway protein I
MTRPASPPAGGFTLLEVLVAFSVLALSLGVLIQVFQGGLRATASTEDYLLATQLAQSKLAELGTLYALETGVEEGVFAERYRWRRTVAPAAWADAEQVARVALQPYDVTIEVRWPERHVITLATVRLAATGPP